MFEKTGQLPDKNLTIAILMLLIFGWILSFSASLGYSGSYGFFIKQSIFISFGLILAFTCLKIPMYFYKKQAKLFFIFTLFCLALVFLPEPIGRTVNGSTRWINLVWFTFQPSEMMKIAMILYMADFLIRHEKDVKKPWMGLIKTLIIISSAGILLMLETDLGATAIISLTALIMLFAAGAYLKQLTVVGVGLFSMAGIGLYIDGLNGGVRWVRMTEFWQIELWANQSEKVHQTKQALIGIARGDWGGVGLGNGIQKYNKLPEPHTDMIFSVIGEEIGIIGMLFVIFTFGFIMLKGFKIAKDALRQKRKYSSYVGFGICTWLSLQFSVNVAMNLGLMPPKGFPLPLISYGGSSMIFVLIALGILLRIDMENRCEHFKQRNYV
ncbi:FtsW/RodA/SpoVE family cell cycle protein [Candidatus Thioglobus sp.]|uniref:FtsW/RodA/SpoVE family cell cycle protein n=1 Tax=Candidatus Thioglobus sp. TaxID=2026721 RepID=UPI003D151CAF